MTRDQKYRITLLYDELERQSCDPKWRPGQATAGHKLDAIREVLALLGYEIGTHPLYGTRITPRKINKESTHGRGSRDHEFHPAGHGRRGRVMAVLYHPDGRTEEVHPADGKSFTLDEMHALVGAEYLDFRHVLEGSYCLVLDDIGVIKGLPHNEAATRIYRADGGQYDVFGPVLYCRLRYPGTAHERWD